MPTLTRVLVFASSALARAGLETLLRQVPSLSVVGSVAQLAALPERVEALQPDVLLAELSEPDEETLAYLSGVAGPTVLLVTDEPTAPWLQAALRGGLRAVVNSGSSAEELVASIAAAAVGLAVLPPDLLAAVLPDGSAPARSGASSLSLSPREKEVLELLTEGVGNKEIAYRLGISDHTVKFHIGSLFQKLRVSTRTEAVTAGIRQGLIAI